MKKMYLEPEFEVTELLVDDLLCVSEEGGVLEGDVEINGDGLYD